MMAWFCPERRQTCAHNHTQDMLYLYVLSSMFQICKVTPVKPRRFASSANAPLPTPPRPHSKNPENSEHLLAYGELCEALGDVDEAMKAYDKALDRTPRMGKAHLRKVSNYRRAPYLKEGGGRRRGEMIFISKYL